MTSPTLSLDSLSSPSPTPSPPPPSHNNPTRTVPPSAHTAPIDTDSELSELTDDDQDASTAAEKRAASTATASSSKGKSGVVVDDDDALPSLDNGGLVSSPLRMAMRGMSRYPNSSRRGGGGRKKRSSIVPAPMWGWVPEKASTNAAVVEEEEEEMTGPPRAMEEEEEEEDDEEEEEDVEDDYDAYGHGNESGEAEDDVHVHRPFSSHRRQGSYSTKRSATNQRRARQSASGKRVLPKHESGDDRPIANGEEDEGSASGGSEYLSTKRRKLTRSRGATSTSRRKKGSDDDGSSGSDVPLSPRKKNGRKAQHEEPEGEDVGMASQGEDNTDSEADPPKTASPTSLLSLKAIIPSTTANSSSALSALAALANAVDPTPPAREVVSITAAAVSASIMTGATLSIEVPQSGTTSEVGTRDPSRSRSNSPTIKSTAEDSADESKDAKNKLKAGKATPRTGKSKPRGKPLALDKKDPPIAANDDVAKPANPAKKGPPPALEIKTNTPKPSAIATGDQDMDVDEEANDYSIEDPDVDMDPSEHDHDEDEDEDEGEAHEEGDEPEEPEPEHADEEAVEADPEAEEEANEGDDDGADPEGEGDEEGDQEQDNDQDTAEVQQDNEDGEDGDNDDEHASQGGDVDVDVEDHESDLQPAHRAEALDVLATIELKFALLRERVYVEKMETLAWEEMLVQNAIHPELRHLQKELSKRRDKRLELASRKRSYEVANAVTRRKADESNLWSWWMFTRDDLQTEMIAETSRKRRKLERERRAIERPQPIRRIPHPMDIINPSLPPPSLRKIIKSYPFGTRKHNKSDTHHHHSHSHYHKNLVYPEIATLSARDIQEDLDLLSQKRPPSSYDAQQQQFLQQQHYPPQLQRNGSMVSGTGMKSIVTNGLPPSMQAAMGPPMSGSMMRPHPQHGMGYESYNDSFGPNGAPGRVRDQYAPQGPGPFPGGPPPGNLRDGMNVYSNFPGPGGRHPPPPSMSMGPSPHHGYPSEHEMSTMAPGGPSSGNGHQLLPNHPYFGQSSMGPTGGPSHGPLPSSSHMSSLHPGSMKGGMGMNGRRSVSPVHVMPNGSASSKANGSWIGMGNFHAGVKGEWDARMMHEDEERERAQREREQRDRKRDEREKEQEQRDREMERAHRDREYSDIERERQREQQMQQMSHRPPSMHGSTSSHSNISHLHSSNAGGPPPGSVGNPHHLHTHHHHRVHHHHVLHHHHPQQGSQQTPPSMPLTGAAPPITHSPRSTREYEGNRPPHGPIHTGPGQAHPTELITLSSDNKRQPSGHWPKIVDEPLHQSSIADYRDVMNRGGNERDSRMMHSGRHSTGPVPPLEGDRPMAMPFVMASSHTMQQTAAGMSSGSHVNGSGLSSSTSSPRGAPSWNTSSGIDDSYRVSASAPPPSGYPHDPHVRSPVQGHRYATSSGTHAPQPLGRMANTSSSSGIHHRRATPPLPLPGRARPPQSPSYPASVSTAHRSPVTSPKLHALSPVPASSSSKHNLSGSLPGPGYSSSLHLAGPGRTLTPTGHHPPLSSGPPPSMQDVVMKNGALPSYTGNSRTASPLMSSLQGSGRPTANGASSDRDRIDRDRERPSPRLGTSVPLPPPSKLSTAQMVDGH